MLLPTENCKKKKKEKNSLMPPFMKTPDQPAPLVYDEWPQVLFRKTDSKDLFMLSVMASWGVSFFISLDVLSDPTLC